MKIRASVYRRDRFCGRQGFAGHCGFVAFQLANVDQSQIRGNDVTDRKLDDVAGDEVRHVDAFALTAADDDRFALNARAQIGDGLLGAEFVGEAQADAEDDDGQDDQRVGAVVQIRARATRSRSRGGGKGY